MAKTEQRGDNRPVPGGEQRRLDALDKVTGAARYVQDIKMPGLLHAALVRSPCPHARVLGLDVSRAVDRAGVVAVLTAADIPGKNTLEGYSRDEHLLAPVGGYVRMVGDALALVVADSLESARAAAAVVVVDYEPLPFNYDAVAAMEPDSEPLHARGNILNRFEIQYGDLSRASSTADLVLDAEYRTPFMEHAALERETVLSYVEPSGRVTVVAGHQQPHWARGWIAALLGLPSDLVRVITPPMGGAFGGRQDPWPLMAGALAAYHVRQPVRLTYTRHESFDASPKRHPYKMNYQVSAREDGTLLGLRLRIVANTGAYDCDGYYIPYYALVAGGGPYAWQAVDGCAWSVYTNGPKAGQMRGFGTPQAAFALECALDEVAARLGVDPLDLRLKNAISDGTETFLGYPVAETVGYRQCLQAVEPHYRAALSAAEAFNRARCQEGGPESPSHLGGGRSGWRRGVGVAGMWYRFGKMEPFDCRALGELGQDGEISFFFSAPDYGQGTTTAIAQLAAESLGLPRDSLRVVNADTALTPDSGIQGASRSTYWVGGAVSAAGRSLRAQIVRVASEMLDRHPDTLSLSPGLVLAADEDCESSRDLRASGKAISVSLAEVAAEMERMGLPRKVMGSFAPDYPGPAGSLGPATDTSRLQPFFLPFFVSGAHVAEVEVQVETGDVRVLRIVAAHDVGRVINPLGARGQVEGAILMGLGSALMEEYLPGVTTGLSDYYLPTVQSMPEIEVILVEIASRWGPLGAKGLGEGAILPVAPAILNGIYHATGARIRELPATAERVLKAIRSRPG
jgi:CO/xanthine dehydrogenase Mo-binding subunit